MNIFVLMDQFSLWWFFLSLAGSIVLSIEFGFYLGKRQHRRSPDGTKIEIGAVVTASLGLLAFMLAITFGTVASRYSERKQLLLDEVNAIGTLFLRADLLPNPEGREIKQGIYDYVTLRAEVSTGEDVPHKVKIATIRFEEMHANLWSQAVAVTGQNPTPINALFLQSLNEVIDLHQKRVAVGFSHRMPSIFWITLFGLAILSMMLSGYNSGVSGGRRSIIATVGVTLAFSTMLLLIIALERPGLIRISHELMIDLQKDLHNSMQILP